MKRVALSLGLETILWRAPGDRDSVLEEEAVKNVGCYQGNVRHLTTQSHLADNSVLAPGPPILFR